MAIIGTGSSSNTNASQNTRTRRGILPVRRGPQPTRRVQIGTAEWFFIFVIAFVIACAAAHYLAQHPLLAIVLALLLLLAGAGYGRYYVQRRRGTRKPAVAKTQAPDLKTEALLDLDDVDLAAEIAELCERDGATVTRLQPGHRGRAARLRVTAPNGQDLLIVAFLDEARVDGRTLDTVYDTSNALGCSHAGIVSTGGFTAEAFDQNQEYPRPLTLVGTRQMAVWADGTGHAPWWQK